jgi:outer membrane receptor protein involved in Fe transport
MKYFISVIVFPFVFVFILNGQAGSGQRATLTGRVSDNATDHPMGAATVTITNRETGNLVTGTVTNMNGSFEISGLPFGVYNIGISFIGYEEVRIDSIVLNEDHPDVSLGKIVLTASDVSLGEVKVVSEKPVVENKFDKIVYNVERDVTAQGTLAIDILRKVPHVTVDAEGNVELQGNSNIRFLINGKTSSIFGSNLSDALASIPASQIKSIEAITNPGSKYDLQGTGGVINIILQENKLKGVSGNVNLSAGTRNQTGSINLGIKRGNFGINGYLSGNKRLGTNGSFSLVRETNDSLTGQSTSLIQSGVNLFGRNGYRAGTGFEWDITKNLNLSGSAGYNNFSFKSSGLIDIDEKIYDVTGAEIRESSTVRDFTNTRQTGSFDWSLDLKKKFKKVGHELDFNFNSSYGRPLSRYMLTLAEFGETNPEKGSESRNPGKDNTSTLSIDYVLPVDSTSTLEAGLKGIFNDITSSVVSNVYVPSESDYVFDPLQSYNLGYSLDIYAAYFSVGFKFLKWLDVKPGIRYEYSDISIDFPGSSVPSYGTIVPSLLLSHSFEEKRSIQLSYSRRIRRPGYNELNPFVNRSDPYNIETGNVLLKPEISDRVEFGFNTGIAKSGSLRITLSQRLNSREIDDITTFYPEYSIGDSVYRNVSVRTRENIGRENNTGVNIFSSVPVTPKLNLRGNLMLFHTWLMSDPNVGNVSMGFRFRGNLNATWQLPRNLVIELFGFWRSGGKTLQGREPQFYIYNFALRKLFWNKNAAFGFTATNFIKRDILQVTTINTGNSRTRSVNNMPFRSFGVSFTYKFGKMQAKQNRNDENESFGENGNQ